MRHARRGPRSNLRTLEGHTNYVNSASFSADGSRVVTGNGGMTAKVWDSRLAVWEPPATPKRVSPEVPSRLLAHTGTPLALNFNGDGSRLITGDTKTARIWDAKSGKELFALAVPGPIIRAQFSEGRILTKCDREAVLRLSDAKTGKHLAYIHPNKGLMREVMFTPDGKRVVALDTTGALTVFGPDGKPITSFAAFDPKLMLNGLAISPDGKKACAAIGKGNEWSVKVWNLEAGKEATSWAASDKPVWGIDWSADGKWIVSGGVDRTGKVWHADTGKLSKTLTGPEKNVARVAITRDGSRVAATCFDGVVRVWDVGSGKSAASFVFETPGTGNVAFSPDGKRLAASGPGVVKVLELPTKTQPEKAPSGPK